MMESYTQQNINTKTSYTVTHFEIFKQQLDLSIQNCTLNSCNKCMKIFI